MTKILLICSSYNHSDIINETLDLQTDKYHVSVIPYTDDRIDSIDQLYQTRDFKRVIIIGSIPEDRTLDTYFPINDPDELEQALDMVWTNEQRDKIIQRVFNVRQRLRDLIIQMINTPLPERTPLTTTWEDRIKEPDTKRHKEEKVCVICLDKDPMIMWVPCQHKCVCDVCAKELMERNDQNKRCPLCREPIIDLFRPI